MTFMLSTVKEAYHKFFEPYLSPPALHYSWLALRLPIITTFVLYDPHLRLGRRNHYFLETIHLPSPGLTLPPVDVESSTHFLLLYFS